MEQFRGALLEAIGDAKPLEVAEPDIAPKEERQFSFIRAIRASATGDWREAGYEREVSDEIARQSGRTPKGFFAPVSAWGQRNLLAGSVTIDGEPVSSNGNFNLQASLQSAVNANAAANALGSALDGATQQGGASSDSADDTGSGAVGSDIVAGETGDAVQDEDQVDGGGG